jgi:cobalt-zinc-cadmium efflux system protein
MDDTHSDLEVHNSHEGHNHGKVIALTHVNRAFIIGIILNLAYVFIQIIIGFRINSLALLSDAGHNFLDVAALSLSLLAFKLNKAKATNKYTYGFKKSSILVSLLNAVVLLISIGAIGYEAILRFKHPPEMEGLTLAIVAAIGIVINIVSAFMFFRNKEKDMNIKAAFLHLAADALVSIGLVVGGIIIYYTHLYWIDPILSLIVCAVIIVSTWKLLKSSLRLSLDGVPENVKIEEIEKSALKLTGITDIHHIHIWAISTTENAMTAHLVLMNNMSKQDEAKLKQTLRHDLEHLNIHHATLETEYLEHDSGRVDCIVRITT